MGQRRRFTPEFKRQAVQLLNAGQRPAAEIAREREQEKGTGYFSTSFRVTHWGHVLQSYILEE